MQKVGHISAIWKGALCGTTPGLVFGFKVSFDKLSLLVLTNPLPYNVNGGAFVQFCSA